ncbi:amidase (plasmid) [Sulfitobacter sp. LCG007]
MTALADATALLAAYRSGETLPSAVVRDCLDRIDADDGRIRSFIHVARDAALDAAQESDRRWTEGAARPLEGIPVAIKDNIAVAGLPTTDGTALFADRVAGQDAHATARLRDAGAVILGKLNMHEGALGATTDNAAWGRCLNPLDERLTPGGSSGGSAAAIAAGFVPLTLGTDTMGSVRIPAAYCGLWGLKPTMGAIGRSGMSYLAWTLDTVGPLARSARDLALAFDLLAGADRADPASDARAQLSPLPEDGTLTLGLPQRDVASEEPEVTRAFDAFLTDTHAAGVNIRMVEVQGWEPGRMRRAGLLISEAEAAHLLAAPLEADDPGLSETFRSALRYGRDASSARLVAAYRHLLDMRPAALAALAEVDALVLPTAPQRAFAHGTVVPKNQADYTALANAAGLPAVAFPIRADGLPASVQLIGLPFADLRLVAMAGRLNRLRPPVTEGDR